VHIRPTLRIQTVAAQQRAMGRVKLDCLTPQYTMRVMLLAICNQFMSVWTVPLERSGHTLTARA